MRLISRKSAGALLGLIFICLAFAPTATAGQGGPGTGGYVWINNPTVSYKWEDISATGTNLNLADDQNKLINFPAGFKTKFYGKEYTGIRVSSNGFLSYTSAATANAPQAIPNAGGPNDVLAVFWMDHYPDCPHPDTGGVFYQVKGTYPERYLVVSWEDMPRFYNSGCIGFSNFQAKIFEGTDYVEYHYRNANSYATDGVVVNICYDLSIGVEGQVSGSTKGLRYVWRDGCVGAYNLVSRAIAWWQDTAVDISNQAFITDRNVALTDTLTASDDPWTMSMTSGPSSGSVDLSQFPKFTYTPNANFVGSDSFKIRLDDRHGSPETATISIKVNGPPVAVNDEYDGNQDTQLVVKDYGFLANDNDPNGDPFTYELVTNPSSGTLDAIPSGNFTYTPNTGFSGTDTFSYKLADDRLEGNIATVTLNIAPAPVLNEAPVVDSQSLETLEDTPITIVPTGSDVNEDPITFSTSATPAFGTLSDNGDGTWTYTPNPDANGVEVLSFTASDGELSSSGDVTITVVPVNDAPVAGEDSLVAAQDAVRNIMPSTLLANDMDIEGSALSITAVAGTSQGGNVVLLGDGTIDYAPPSGFTGQDTFSYTLSDGEMSSTGTVLVEVAAADQVPPTAAFSWTTDAPVLTTQIPITFVSESAVGGSAIVSETFTVDGFAMENPFIPETVGDYQVTLTVVDENGLQDSVTKTVTVGNAKPAGEAVMPTGAVTPGLPIEFSINVDDDGPVTVVWDLEGQQLEGNPITYKFQGVGQFEIVATITDAHGITTTLTQTVVVEEHKGATRNGGGGNSMAGLQYAPPSAPTAPAEGPAPSSEVMAPQSLEGEQSVQETSNQVTAKPQFLEQNPPTSTASYSNGLWVAFMAVAAISLVGVAVWGVRRVRTA